jgi:non-homologous end joining protein Ku
VPETAEPNNVVDIMDALKRSLQAGADRRPRAPSKKTAEAAEPARKTTARKTGARKAAR